MALLTRVAQSSEGAKVLLQAGLLSRLAECAFLDQRPEHERTVGLASTSVYGREVEMASFESGFVPTVAERYRQLLVPALKVTLAILTALGPQHREASIKVHLQRLAISRLMGCKRLSAEVGGGGDGFPTRYIRNSRTKYLNIVWKSPRRVALCPFGISK